MLDFVKKNAHFIWRLILNQIGLTLFGLMTAMSAAAIDNTLAGEGNIQYTCMIWVSVFAIIFYMFIDYAAIKEEGQKDKIRIDAGRLERDRWRGLKIVLIASIPNLVLGLLVNVCGPLGADPGPALEWAGAIAGTSKVIGIVIQAMYWGVLIGLTGTFSPGAGVTTIADVPNFCYALIPLPAIICVTLAYIAGLHDISLIRKIKGLFKPEPTANKK